MAGTGQKTITATISDDGTIEFDQVGYTGKSCSGDIRDLLNSMGSEKSVTKKAEYYNEDQQQIEQRF